MKFINTLVTFASLFTSSCMGIEVIGSIGTASDYSAEHTLTIKVPEKTEDGDLLVLVGSVTEGLLPEDIGHGFKPRASCFKRGKGSSCKSFHEDYGGSYDLGQVIYTKKAESGVESFTFTFGEDLAKPGKPDLHKTLLTLVTLHGASTSDPIRTWESDGLDDSNKSNFPSIDVVKGDMVLLSMSFDDGYDKPGYIDEDKDFLAPSNFERIGTFVYKDETNMVYAREWPTSGSTGDMQTKGGGGSKHKDVLISLAVKPSGEGEGDEGDKPDSSVKGSCALMTAHGTYISFDSSRDIVDQATSIGILEKFELIEKDDYVAVYSPHRDTYMRFGRDRSEVSQQPYIGGWEKFEIVGSLSDTFSLYNKKFETYLQADRDMSIVDQQTRIGGWGKFTCVPV